MIHLLDVFYSSPVAVPLTLLILSIIALLSWIGKGRQLILALSLFLYVRYMVWRGLYTLNTADLSSALVSWILYLAEGYGLFQFLFFAYQAWSPTQRNPVPLKHYPTVDMMVTVVNEPLHILRRTLVGCLQQDYPKDKFNVYVLDDGHRDDVEALANSLVCQYLRRPDRPRHAKAGNLNHALRFSSGEFVAVFDVDHVPVRSFLKDTLGFFQDKKVAMVQTPHHFYNPDIFQKNLALERHLKNEQDLFFLTLQAGRDRHNSAFFAGSGGLFRRRPLEEIGGFQTKTLTEDIHTSLLLHAKGYKSCYLNKVLSAGLMPETFEGYIKQRTRWAIGCIQVLFKDNPLIKRGLTISQRIDYFGSIYYFLHGLPRLVCLVGPLFALLLGVSPLRAEALMLVHFFGAYYLASLATIRTVSKGTRNAFWSDIYEVAMCFALSRAALKTIAAPFKHHSFEITPKGQKIEKTGHTRIPFVLPHLIVFGLLIAGVTIGIRQWMGPRTVPGLEVSLFWGIANLILLSVAIFAARERPQWRNLLRLDRRFPCELVSGSAMERGKTHDLNELGVSVELSKPLLTLNDFVTVTIHPHTNRRITLQGLVVRQDRKLPDGVEVAIQFQDLDDPTIQTLIHEMFSRQHSWADASKWCPGMFRSFWSLVTALARVSTRLYPRRRRAPRVNLQKECRFSWQGLQLIGTTQDVSFTGLSVLLPVKLVLGQKRGVLRIGCIALKVLATSAIQRSGRTLIRFRVESIEQGEQQWRELNYSSWQHS